MARAFTKPTITMRGMNRISFATPRAARMIWRMPARMTVAMKWSMPYSRAMGAITSATAPVAAEIMAGRPPTMAMVTAMTKLEKSPT